MKDPSLGEAVGRAGEENKFSETESTHERGERTESRRTCFPTVKAQRLLRGQERVVRWMYAVETVKIRKRSR
jgi:hypothetical protein